ncbi:MAG: excinuclease ABC subunit UvrB [Candidatus Beckwithbacteria bacterium]|nr:excinuclease ABC subunit UvrB [Candidatus Beckwithbacteria bacterium]
MPFLLKSDFQPTGDQPQAIDKLVQGVNKGKSHQTLLGVTGSGKTFTIANVIVKTQKPTLVISHNKTLAAQLYQEFRDFFPQNAVSYFVSYYDYYQPEAYIPASDTYIEKETDINDEIDKLRLSATANLLSRPDVIVVASVSCIYNLGSPVEYGRKVLELIEGQLIDRQTLFSRLTDLQYERNDTEIKRGCFQIKGESLIIWPAYSDQVIRLILLDNQIESISFVKPLTLQLIKQLKPHPYRANIYPAKHYLTNPVTQTQALKQINLDLQTRLKEFKTQGKIVEGYRLEQKVTHDLEMIKALGYVNGIENYSRYFDGRRPGNPPFTLLDYFEFNTSRFKTNGFLTIIDESHMTIPQIRGMYRGDQSRKTTLIDYGFRLPSALDNRPLKFLEFLHRVHQVIYTSATPEEWEISQSGNQVVEQLIRPTGLIDPAISIRKTNGQIEDLIKEILKRVKKNERVLITTLTKKTAEALSNYLKEKKISVQYLHSDVKTLDRSDILEALRKGDYDAIVGINLLREGLDLPEVSLVVILDADKAGFLRSRASLIQTMGRASRNINGQVLMYADSITKSMKTAISEINRRRQIQIKYNLQHKLTPKSISKPIRQQLVNQIKAALPEPIPLSGLTPEDREKLVRDLTRKMNQSAKNMDFEVAAQIRDIIKKLKQ